MSKITFSISKSIFILFLNFLFGFLVYTGLKILLHYYGDYFPLIKKYFSLYLELFTNLIMIIFLVWLSVRKLGIDIKTHIHNLKKDFYENIWLILLTSSGYIAFVLFMGYLSFPSYGLDVFKTDLVFLKLKSFISNNPYLIVLFYINIVLITPIKEEVIIRRFIYISLRNKFGFIISTFISSLLFSIMHADIIKAFLYSVAASYIYEKHSKLNINIMIHSIINLFVISSLFFL
jgi:membrane protease YdiL (CAAX protease family)